MVSDKNTGVSYETLTQAFFQAILEQDAVRNVRVEHNVKLAGLSGAQHQIDVFWAFEVGGIRYQTVVQCKDWNSRVKQEQVLAFSAVLNDIAGQPRGIMVSKLGFQAGAETVAKAHGIALYRLREADEDYWAGSIQKIELTMQFVVPQVEEVKVNFDMAWLEMRKKELGLETVSIQYGGLAGDMRLVLEDGSPAGTVAETIERSLSLVGTTRPLEPHEAPFREPTYLVVPNSPVGNLKLVSITFKGGHNVLQQKMLIDGADAIKFVLESFDGLHVYTADGQLRVTKRTKAPPPSP